MRLMLILSYAGGARARRDQTLQICRSVPTYAEVCMIDKKNAKETFGNPPDSDESVPSF